MAIKQNSKKDQSNERGKTTESCPLKEEEEEIIKKTSIRISLYFDGTANNRTNVNHRLNKTSTYEEQKKKWFGIMESFGNDHSNISKLESIALPESPAEHNISLYVEGIGTNNDSGDSIIGLALGKGATGVTSKVENGLKEALKRIKKLNIPKSTVIEYIHLDTFGFSRGAAAARYCVHVATKDPKFDLKKGMENEGRSVEEFKVKFVGLYDTVASIGIPSSHHNDTKQMKLDAIKVAEKVVHLAAAEEHRANFRLTNISSCGPKGIELFLPGVHSDIGGGYNDYADELDRQVLDLDVLWSTQKTKQRFIDEKHWLIHRGWFDENSSKGKRPESKETTASDIQEVNFWNELKVNRYHIRNSYSLLPLHYMADYAIEAELSYKKTKLKLKFAIPKDLSDTKEMLDKYIEKCGPNGSKWQDWFDKKTEEMKKLRHKYFHFSAYYGSANAPQFNNQKKRERIIQNG